MKRCAIVIFVLLFSLVAIAQDKKISFGFVGEPIIPTKLFRITKDVKTIADSVSMNQIVFTSTPRYGYAFGAIMKIDYSPRLSFETGINYLVRNYKMEVEEPGYHISLSFNEDSYEIPLTVKYFLRLADRLYLSNAVGVSLIMIPGSVMTKVVNGAENSEDYYIFEQHSYIMRTMMPAFKGGFGLNYRTENSGQLYLETYYRLFSTYYDTRLLYYNAATRTDQINVKIKSIGDYFGFSLKYTFPPSDFIKRTKKQQKK